MLNNIVLVGKVKEAPVARQTSLGNMIYYLILEVDKPFKNSDGTLSVDVFQVFLWKGIAEQYMNILKEGTFVTIKGRLQSNVFESEKNKIFYNAEIFAEKLSIIPQKN